MPTNEALVQRLIKPHEIITSAPPRREALRGLLANAAPTRNEFEDAVHALLDGLPRPDVNQREGIYVPDFRWTGHSLILEADGTQFHGHILAREDDKTRQAELEARAGGSSESPGRRSRASPPRTRARIESALRRSAG